MAHPETLDRLVRRVAAQDIEVLVNGVGGSEIPISRDPHLRRQDGPPARGLDEGVGEGPRPAPSRRQHDGVGQGLRPQRAQSFE